MKKIVLPLSLFFFCLHAMEPQDKSQKMSETSVTSTTELIKKAVEVKSLREISLERVAQLITDFKQLESLPFELKEEFIYRYGDKIVPHSKGKLLIHGIQTHEDVNALIEVLTRGNNEGIVTAEDDEGNNLLNALIIQGKTKTALDLLNSLRAINEATNKSFKENIFKSINQRNSYKRTPLINAIIQQDEDLAKDLIDHLSQKYINAQDIVGRTPLFYALQFLPSLVLPLLEKGAGIDISDKNGETPLQWITYVPLEKRDFITNLFKSYKVEIPSEASQDFLIDAKRLQHGLIKNVTTEDDLARLIEKQFDFNATDYEGNTLLNRLLLNNNHTLTRRLLDLVDNLDVSIPNDLGETPLMNAIAFGYEDIVQEILKRFKEKDSVFIQQAINSRDALGRTALIYAAFYMPSLIPDLIRLGARVIVYYQEDLTPLSIALERNANPEIIELLLNASNGTYDNKDARAMIFYQAARNTTYPEVIDLLVKAGFDINPDYGDRAGESDEFMPPLEIAAEFNQDPAIVQKIIEQGANLEQQGSKALLNAAKYNNIKVFELLLNAGVPLISDDYDSTLLNEAIKANNNEIALYLIEKKGFDINLKDEEDLTPLMQAVLAENIPMITYLFDKGADINLQDATGMSAVMWAAQQISNSDIMKLILDHKPDISLKDGGGSTAFLHAAFNNNNLDILKMLLKKGAQLEDKNNNNETAVHIAARSNENPDIIRYLIDKNILPFPEVLVLILKSSNKGARLVLERSSGFLEIKNEKGQTPLLYFIDQSAATKNDNAIALVTLLLKSGANIDAQDTHGNTPLLLALTQQKSWLVPLLLQFNPNLGITNLDGKTAYDVLKDLFMRPGCKVDKKIQDRLLEQIKPKR